MKSLKKVTSNGVQVEPKYAKPFLKWVGGKKQLLPQYDEYFPAQIRHYFEPFVGGGAVFFHLWSKEVLTKEAFLFDTNEELVNTYLVIRDNVKDLIGLLREHEEKHNEDHYYEVRSLDRKDIRLSDVERAARTIYLNRTCYNGLYRVNSSGQFNVPMGSYKNPQILYSDVLRAAHFALQNTKIETRDFRTVVELAQEGDFFYFDPPYVPVTKTANFTSYTAMSFGERDQRELADVFKALDEKGCLCMLSNSHAPLVLELYSKFNIKKVNAKRAVNSDVNGRGAVTEVVVLNY